MGPLMELALMCRATVLLSNASAARRSYIPEPAIGPNSPQIFPAELALELSAAEAEARTDKNSAHRWSDVNTGFNVAEASEDSVVFSHDGGRQELALVGRGDFNHDGIEDLLITSRDSVKGGSYFNVRLFALTIGPNGDWSLIGEYHAMG